MKRRLVRVYLEELPIVRVQGLGVLEDMLNPRLIIRDKTSVMFGDRSRGLHEQTVEDINVHHTTEILKSNLLLEMMRSYFFGRPLFVCPYSTLIYIVLRRELRLMIEGR
jgi:hypothetical protein